MIRSPKEVLMKHVNDFIDESVSEENVSDSQGEKVEVKYSEKHKEDINDLDNSYNSVFCFCKRLFASDIGYEAANELNRMSEKVLNPRLEEVRKHRNEIYRNCPDGDFTVSKAIKFLKDLKIPTTESKGTKVLSKQETLEKILNPRIRTKRAIIESYVNLRFPDDEVKRNKLLRVFGYCRESGTSEEFYEKWNEFDCCCTEKGLEYIKTQKYKSRIHTVRRFAIVSSEGNNTYTEARNFLEEFYRHYGFALTGDEKNIEKVFNADNSTLFDIGDRLTLEIIKNDYFGKMSIKNTECIMNNPFWYYVYIIENYYASELTYFKKMLGLSTYGYFLLDTAIKDGEGRDVAAIFNRDLNGK